MHVVHRVEPAPGKKGEISAVPREDRILVLETAVGDIDDRTVGDPRHLDLPQRAADAGVGPGDPVAVRGEREVGDGAVDGADQLGEVVGDGLGDGLSDGLGDGLGGTLGVGGRRAP